MILGGPSRFLEVGMERYYVEIVLNPAIVSFSFL